MKHFYKQTINVAKEDITENEFYMHMQTLALKASRKGILQFRNQLLREHMAKALIAPNVKGKKICCQV